MAGINIPFLADVAAFLRGTKDVEGALDDVADSLDDLDRAGEDAGDSAGRALADGIEDGLDDAKRSAEDAGRDIAKGVEDGLDGVGDAAKDAGDELGDRLEDGAKEAEDGADRLERSFRDSLDSVRDSSREAGDSIGREVKRGTDEGSEGFNDLKDEAGSSGREAAASFSGEFDDITDLIQETAANAFGGFGPLGAAAGIAAAAGIGILVSEFEKAKEEAQETAESVADIASEMIELGTTDVNATQIRDRLREAAETAEDGSNELERWGEMAERAGVSTEDFALAMVGDMDAAVRVQEQLAESQGRVEQAYDDQQQAAAEMYNSWHGLSGEAQTLEGGVMDVRAALEEQTGQTEQAAGIFDYYNDIMREGPDAQAEYAEAVREMEEQTADYLASAGESWEDYVTDGVLALDEYNANIEAHIQAVEQYEQNMVTASETLTDEALNYLRELGPEAAPLLQAFVDAPLEEQQRTADNWHTLGLIASDGYDSGLDLAGPTGLEIGRAQGVANARPIQVPVEVSGVGLGFQVGALVGSIRPPAIEVPVIAKGIL